MTRTQLATEVNYAPIAVTIDIASAITGLSRRTLDVAIHAGVLKPVNTGSSGTRQLLLVSDLIKLLTFAQETETVLNDDLAHMAQVTTQIKEMKKKGK